MPPILVAELVTKPETSSSVTLLQFLNISSNVVTFAVLNSLTSIVVRLSQSLNIAFI